MITNTAANSSRASDDIGISKIKNQNAEFVQPSCLQNPNTQPRMRRRKANAKCEMQNAKLGRFTKSTQRIAAAPPAAKPQIFLIRDPERPSLSAHLGGKAAYVPQNLERRLSALPRHSTLC
jgi:hypothetical protein